LRVTNPVGEEKRRAEAWREPGIRGTRGSWGEEFREKNEGRQECFAKEKKKVYTLRQTIIKRFLSRIDSVKTLGDSGKIKTGKGPN